MQEAVEEFVNCEARGASCVNIRDGKFEADRHIIQTAGILETLVRLRDLCYRWVETEM
jgi:hypothetical protein